MQNAKISEICLNMGKGIYAGMGIYANVYGKDTVIFGVKYAQRQVIDVFSFCVVC
jgi:hypothetical protein